MALKKSASSTVKKLYNKASQNYSAKLAGSKSLLYNKFVLYTAFIVCLINLVIWLFSGEFIHVAVFLLVGYLTTYFSKNMIVILVIALVVSNVVKSGTSIVLEGMEGGDNQDGVYHAKEGARNRKEGMESSEGMDESNEGMNESNEGMNESNESNEGMDESYEGVDGDESESKEKTCLVDKDCEKGFKCNEKYVCASAK